MIRRYGLCLLVVMGVLGLVTSPSLGAVGSPKVGILPPQAEPFGLSLGEWMDQYFQWWFTAPDNLVPARVGGMTLMPLPVGEQTGGSWTPEDPAYLQGTIDVTLEAGSPFLLPCVTWTLEIYEDGSRDEPFPYWPLSEFQTYVTDTNITLDGKEILRNYWDYYVERELDPPVVYREPSSYGSVAAWALQGVGFIAAPLKVGQHQITLYEQWVVPGWFGLIYDNTWNITVVPPQQ